MKGNAVYDVDESGKGQMIKTWHAAESCKFD